MSVVAQLQPNQGYLSLEPTKFSSVVPQLQPDARHIVTGVSISSKSKYHQSEVGGLNKGSLGRLKLKYHRPEVGGLNNRERLGRLKVEVPPT
jgi:hypothetical protein